MAQILLGGIMRLMFFLTCLWSGLIAAQGNADKAAELQKLAWQKGPIQASIGDKATISVPEGYVFLDAPNTRKFLELSGNPGRDGHYLFAPASGEWWSVFTFNPSGYVKDDEKIDPDELLRTLKESDAPSNEERKRLGMHALYTEGWQVPPHYDVQTKRLEWGTRLRTDSGAYVVNYTSRLLGRSGVMSAILVSDPRTLSANTALFQNALSKFSYVSGEQYAQYKSGDKLAKYGLAALIVGGAAAVATKKGLWAPILAFLAASWKFVIAGIAALGAGLGKIFGRKKE